MRNTQTKHKIIFGTIDQRRCKMLDLQHTTTKSVSWTGKREVSPARLRWWLFVYLEHITHDLLCQELKIHLKKKTKSSLSVGSKATCMFSIRCANLNFLMTITFITFLRYGKSCQKQSSDLSGRSLSTLLPMEANQL